MPLRDQLKRTFRSGRTWRLLLGSALLLGALGTFFVWSVPVPPACLLPDATTPGTLTLLDARGEPLAEVGNATARSRHPVELAAMGPDLPRVTVALEDRRFYTHGGLDGRALVAAAGRNVLAGRIVSGASTLTQQFVKLRAGRPDGRRLLTKLRESVAAAKLERQVDKPTLLTRYLNALSYGNRLVGPEAAARAYFGKAARDLSLAESVYLAGLPQAPTRFNPWRHPAAAEFRYGRNVRRLAALGLLNAAESQRLADHPPHPGHFLPVRRAGHFTDLVTSRLRGATDPTANRSPTPHPAPEPGNDTLLTTLDPDLQRVAENLTRRHLEELRRSADADPQAAVVIVENSSGAVRALVGSGNYKDPHQGQVNGAVRPRSAGSTLKPFLYLYAVDHRLLTAASLLPDTAEAARLTFADYDPQNYHADRHLGPVRVRVALGSSLNIPAIVTLGRYVGARQAFYEFGRWGFRFREGLDDYGAGFILGNAEIRLLDLAGAYAGLARGGLAGPARLLARDSVPLERVASPEACAIITDILCDPEARRATFGAGSPLDFPADTRVAVKTGTSSGFRDKWCVGFDGRHTVAVWSGHFDGHPMDEATAIHAAAPLWHALMDHLLREHHDPPVPAPEPTAKLLRREVCPITGLKPAPEAEGLAGGVPEWFLAGTEPTGSAADWFVRDVPDTPPHLRLPAEYAAWCASPQNNLHAFVPAEATGPDAPLLIVSPPDHARYTVDPELPASQQMLELTANTLHPEQIRWTVNGQPVAAQPDGHVFWPLTRGDWQVGAELPGTSTKVVRQVEVD